MGGSGSSCWRGFWDGVDDEVGFRGEVVDVGAEGGGVCGHLVPGCWGETFKGFLEGGHLVSSVVDYWWRSGVWDGVGMYVSIDVLSVRRVGCLSRLMPAQL